MPAPGRAGFFMMAAADPEHRSAGPAEPARNRPAVSIGLPVFNGEDYLELALRSLLEQTCEDFELIISDNASTDRTEEICREFGRQDSRIVYVRQERNLGAAANYNLVFRMASGKYFKWAAHDDVCHNRLLATCLSMLEGDPAAVLAAGRTALIGPDGDASLGEPPILELEDASPSRRLKKFFEFHSPPSMCNEIAGLARRAILSRTRLIGAYPGSDMVLLAHIGLLGKILVTDEVLFFRRDHPNRSVRASATWQERAAWFSPEARPGVRLPVWRWTWELARVVSSAPISALERLRCLYYLGLWAGRQRRALLGELRNAASVTLRRSGRDRAAKAANSE